MTRFVTIVVRDPPPSDRSSVNDRDARRGRRSTWGRQRHGAVQIIAKLREGEVELARGKTAGEVCRKLGSNYRLNAPAVERCAISDRHCG